MTTKQATFIQEYLTDLDATNAARRAGYSDGNYGRQLLTHPDVRQAIDQALIKRARKAEKDAQWVIERLTIEAEQANSDSARVRALELLGKHFGITFTDTVKHVDQETIEIDLVP